jgi:hypothetical protein
MPRSPTSFDNAPRIVILPALSDFAKGGRRPCFNPGEGSLFTVSLRPLRLCGLILPLVFLCVLCVKSFEFLSPPQIDLTGIFTTSSTCITSFTINPSAYFTPTSRP